MTGHAFAIAMAALGVNGPEGALPGWDSIDWRSREDSVRRLRQRIFKATQAGDWAKVRSLQKLMLRSRSNTLVSVRQVTQRNAGRRTAGVDGEVALTSADRARLADRAHQTRGSQDRIVRCTSRAIALLAGLSSATTPSIPSVRRPALRWVTCRTLMSVLLHDRSMSFCRFLAFARSPSRTAVKILRRSRATFCPWTAQFTASHVSPSSGPFAVPGI